MICQLFLYLKKIKYYLYMIFVSIYTYYKTCIYMYNILNKLCHPIILDHFTLTYKKDLIPGVTVILFNLILNIII